MRYQPRDRGMVCDFGFWWETLEVWKEQGLPAWVNDSNTNEFFGMDAYTHGVGNHCGLQPGFGFQILEDRGDHEVVQDDEGVITLRKKFMSSIPIHIGHTLVDRESWKKEFLPRLDPSSPERLPKDWPARVERFKDPAYDHAIDVFAGSLYGWIRNWMGVEAVSYVVYDDPAWFEEMVDTIADCVVGTLQRVFDAGVRPDACSMWEDMCYNGGPLLSPEHFAKYLVPRYRRITDLLHRYGVNIVWNDCDGKIDALIPHWLEGGVNCLFPIEVGTWGGDPVRYRKEYGKDLLLMGGFDKHLLARGEDSIQAEIERLTPLVEEGGYIPFCDHRVPPDVPLKNYLYYLRTVRRVWGKDHATLAPMHDEALALLGS